VNPGRLGASGRSAISRLFDLSAQLEEDAGRAQDALRRRDRALAAELAPQEGESGDEHVVAAWLDRVRPPAEGGVGERAERAHRALAAVLAGLGALVGAGTAAALFHYDGGHPVNVVRVLGVFVGVQLVLLLATAVTSLPHLWRDAIPAVGVVRDGLALFSPARWQRGLQRLLPGPEREASQRLLAMLERQRRLYGDVEKWWLLSGSQWFGVTFNLGALATALALVAFTDLAFAWSTTLDLSEAAFLRVTSLLALPWRWIWTDALPTAELIASTQYFRASGHHSSAGSAPWWRFVLACMLVYGLAPRLAFLVLARWRLDVAVRRACRRIPGLAALRDRLDSQLVETGAESDEAPVAESRPVLLDSESEVPGGGACHAVAWSGFPIADADAASRALGVEVLSLRTAGEGAIENDAEALRALASTGGDAPVLVLTKAWEPPVLELLDFVADLRGALGEGRAIVVAPLALVRDGLGAPAESDVGQWCRAVDRLADPWTSIYTPAASR
jgi:hypothetical protein